MVELMNRCLHCLLFLLLPAVVHAQEPGLTTIQAALNEGLELEFPAYQEFANMEIIRGGPTSRGDHVYLGTGRLIWKLSSAEFAALMEERIAAEVEHLDDGGVLARELTIVLQAKLSRIGPFESGDTVSTVRFRIRLEEAGTDWIVAEARIKESNPNPLLIIDGGIVETVH